MSAATVSGSKTVTTNVSPGLTATALTAILAIAPENLSMAQLGQLRDACNRSGAGSNPNSLIGACLP
jgi:hypothetical protein